MNGSKRPLSVTILACLYLAVGIIGFVSHSPELKKIEYPYDALWVELVEVLAIVCGVFLLQGRNWARWAALAWIAFHVGLSIFRNLGEFAVHALFCAVVAWLLFFRPAAVRYFRKNLASSS